MSANRRKQTAVGLGLLIIAIVLHMAADEATRRAITPSPPSGEPGREYEFFGEDPREFASRPENQARLADARRIEGLAFGVAVFGMLVLVAPLPGRRQGPPREDAIPADTGAPRDGPGVSLTRPAGPPTADRPAARS